MAYKPERTVRLMVQNYVQLYPGEVARELESLSGDSIAGLLRELPVADATRVLDRLLPDAAVRSLETLEDAAFRNLLTALDPAKAAMILARLDRDRRTARLALLEPALARELSELLEYSPDSAGAIMDPNVTALRPDTTVKQTLAALRKLPERRIHYMSVVDDEGRLLGRVPLQDLAIAEPTDRLETLLPGPSPSVQATSSQTEVVELFQQTRLTSLPVTDYQGRLIGVIRHGALVTAFHEEASADIQTMVGASKDERALSSVPFAVRKRLPWLQINLATAFLAAFVVGLFEGTIARYTALAVLLPIAAGQSGNTGAQALAVTMRGLTLREIRVRHWLRLAFKEFSVGFINGVAVALVTALAVFLWSGSSGLALVIGSAMVISMVIAGMAGASVPMVLTLLKQDPAQSSSIILTTVTDVAGFLSFLGLATLAAGWL